MHATIMAGERDAKIDLATLSERKNLYALGPMTGLAGEITVIDSRPSLARVGPSGAPQIEQSFEGGAPFLVWSSVRNWRDHALPASVQSVADLEGHLSKLAAEKGWPAAFPFTIAGRFDTIHFHILNAKPDAPFPAGQAAHREIQARFESGPSQATLIGFFSTAHEGVFIHRGALTHIHFQDRDSALSGHVDELALGAGPFVLKTPYN